MKKNLEKLGHRKLTLKVSILHILTTFTQVTVRLKNFLVGCLLVLGLKECLVECATLCVKSEVMLHNKHAFEILDTETNEFSR